MNYLVKVRSIDGEQMEHETITHGELCGDANDYTLTYNESVEDGIAETVIRVLGGECVIVRRTAPMQTHMVIEAGKKHISQHKLPFGEFNLEVVGSRVESVFDENMSELQFAYVAYQDNQVVSELQFYITVKKKKAKTVKC